jgi:hypothetical protein
MMGTNGPVPKRGERMGLQTRTEHFHRDRYGIARDRTLRSCTRYTSTRSRAKLKKPFAEPILLIRTKPTSLTKFYTREKKRTHLDDLNKSHFFNNFTEWSKKEPIFLI